ncbi:virB8 family protein [Rickettsia conorii subsp. heilongjiangensis]|uniref:VirB8 family protein n=1 Tax=Rickettsia conorii subsp. heilongjiangensis TaxID=226665 RepID=A0AAD1GHX7_RICCR|nr:virB8 family protein [Rickettsia conorii]AEK74431.1 virB8 protein [Rickettsia conorii subsp. heilongjiangensis 054]BBM91206.1 virB8 family protein [Rickettsia conorii subsp. heilongjiangensis]BBM92415.1 virB8 family protein [Rickettsia conorii subsp. heilongjiangensis]BBM93624.1 virB8 family protein [Rickettsia conorii subsp. heilongjiangensis]BBM94833.1 virB8 family protein [Rickettsia conorii subsp. heilongjiangensis]
MDPLTNAIQEYIKSGEYFIDARKWYNFKYILPLSHRSLLLLICTIFTLLLTLICININILLPINKKVSYLIKDDAAKQATITNTKHSTLTNPYISIANIMLQNYVKQREEYNYDILKEQFTFIKNASTSIVYMQFANFMNIDNPLSPVIRYQKLYRRSINILSINNINYNEAVVTFESLAKNSTDAILENMVWEARVGFIMDSISTNTSPDMPFNFTVTSYKLKLLRNKNQK